MTVVSLPVDSVALLEVVMFPVMLVSLLAVVVSLLDSLDVVVSPRSKIRAAMEPLAENVSPVAFVLEVVVFVLVVLVVPVVFPVLVVVVFCAIAGVRLNALAKSPKTSTSATAIGAFFIAKSVHK
jgi:hypothetical protein